MPACLPACSAAQRWVCGLRRSLCPPRPSVSAQTTPKVSADSRAYMPCVRQVCSQAGQWARAVHCCAPPRAPSRATRRTARADARREAVVARRRRWPAAPPLRSAEGGEREPVWRRQAVQGLAAQGADARGGGMPPRCHLKGPCGEWAGVVADEERPSAVIVVKRGLSPLSG